MKIPGPDHPIAIEPSASRVRVTFNGRVVADTRRALKLTEANYPPVFYVPREDADQSILEKTATRTHCPYKGDASYYSIKAGDKTAADAIWSYETPFPAMQEIARYLAFYPKRVDSITEEKA